MRRAEIRERLIQSLTSRGTPLSVEETCGIVQYLDALPPEIPSYVSNKASWTVGHAKGIRDGLRKAHFFLTDAPSLAEGLTALESELQK